MDWFRMYHQARTDNKLKLLSDSQHRVWFNLLCFGAEQAERGVITSCSRFLLAAEVANGDEALLDDTLAMLQKLDIAAVSEDGTITIVNWRKRQYDKPSAEPERVKERVAKSRAKKQAEAQGICSNADVTPSNALDTEAETELTTTATPPLPPDEPIEMTDSERKVVDLVKQVRGMQPVSAADIVRHLREIAENRGSPVSEAAVIRDAMNFRDHWNARRQSQPKNAKWRDWRKSMTNWFSTTREIDDARQAPSPRNGTAPHSRPDAGGRYEDHNVVPLEQGYIRPRITG